MASSTWLSGGMQGTRGLPNVIACNTGINACKEAKQWHQALGHLAGMQMAHGLPNVIAYSAAISACVKAEHWHQALCLLAVMQMAHVIPNVITSLVTRCKPADAALQVLACGAWGGAWLYLGPWSLEVRTAALQTMGHQRVFMGSYHSGNGAYWGLVEGAWRHQCVGHPTRVDWHSRAMSAPHQGISRWEQHHPGERRPAPCGGAHARRSVFAVAGP